MYRTDAPGSSSGMFVDKAPGVPGTVVDKAWMNDKQEELCLYVLSRGLSLNKTDQTLLRQAITDHIGDETKVANGQRAFKHIDDLNTDTGMATLLASIDAKVAAAGLPANYIQGFNMAWIQATDRWDIGFTTGQAQSTAGPIKYNIIDTTGTWNKIVVAASGTAYSSWVAADGNGGVASGVPALADGVWLHAFAIFNSDTGAVDFGFDDALDAAKLKTITTWGADFHYRRIGSIRIEALGGGKFGITKFAQRGDVFTWFLKRGGDQSVPAQEPTPDVRVVETPLGVTTEVRIDIQLYNPTGLVTYYAMDGLQGSVPHRQHTILLNSALNLITGDREMMLLTDTSQQIQMARSTVETFTMIWGVIGWRDFRGKL